jgi:hypothetical protein
MRDRPSLILLDSCSSAQPADAKAAIASFRSRAQSQARPKPAVIREQDDMLAIEGDGVALLCVDHDRASAVWIDPSTSTSVEIPGSRLMRVRST